MCVQSCKYISIESYLKYISERYLTIDLLYFYTVYFQQVNKI